MRAPAAVLLAATAACGSTTGPSDVEVEFKSEIVFGIPTLPTAARMQSGALVITGVVQTPGTGYNLLGEFTRLPGRRLQLEVHAYDNAPGVPFTSQMYYRAIIRNLAAGPYDLLVLHNHHAPSPGRIVQAYHDTVRVE